MTQSVFYETAYTSDNKIFKYLFNCEKLSKSLRKSLKAGGKQIYAKKF